MIIDLIYKYLDNEASEAEVLIVFEWIQISQENKEEFIALKKAWIFSALSNEKSTMPIANFKNLKNSIVHKRRYRFLKYAAIVLLFITLGKSTGSLNNLEVSFSKVVVLELGDGSKEYISNNQIKNFVSDKGSPIAQQIKSELIYKIQNASEALIYNTLKVPFGQTFKVTLADGTVIHLNAGTSLKYPQQFGNNKERKVFLTGEAFFEVAKDKLHPFVVECNQVRIEVLGTKFNISAYPDESNTETILVEGSVKLSEIENENNTVILVPNERVKWDASSKKFNLETVDSGVYVAWVNNELVFKDASFGFICKKLERAFDVIILNSNSTLTAQKFTGTINIKGSNPEDILDLINLDTPFQYSKQGRIIKISN
ncbi:FecR family protein [Flavobacterium segetis]|uniref:FecR family protein n=1 Tax=Flavobacterium segetis TaxID=271157 RepID=A0A1M5JAX6_9FLAO|nr:FecR domain-containing protein [Flavobacterium segetis]SHG37724.1 FecR family protein [Flavobacterium segetis]